MFKTIQRHIFPAFFLLVALTLATGAIYPLLFTAAAQFLFPHRANGSIIMRNGEAVGSELIGQPFADSGHFWGRPSATAERPYDAASSSGSNLGPTNPVQLELMRSRAGALRAAHGEGPVPAELLYASGSGLDPHISPAAAYYQAARVAKASGMEEKMVRDLIEKHIEPRQFGLLGEPRVNVLSLNLALDAMRETDARP